MRNKSFAIAKGVVSFFGFVVVLFLFVAAAANGALSSATTPQISAGLQVFPPLATASIGEQQLNKAVFTQKTSKLQIPFITNNGQADGRVRFYANTFGGTVFVTKDGEIVYSLPKSGNSGDRSQGRRSKRPFAPLHVCWISVWG